jgi:hypothetical protein
MIKPHEPFQDGSKHAANEYCPTCHGPYDWERWDAEGNYRPESQDTQAKSAGGE